MRVKMNCGMDYISVQGGHRVGVTGKVILDRGNIRSIKYISCINVRACTPDTRVCRCGDAFYPKKRKNLSYTSDLAAGLWQDDASSGHGAPDQQRE